MRLILAIFLFLSARSSSAENIWDDGRPILLGDNRRFNGELFEFQSAIKGETISFKTEVEQVSTTSRESSPPSVPQPDISDDRKLKLGAVVPDRREVPIYEKIEFTIDLQATFSNAFDPDEIDVVGFFTDPNGREIMLPAFFYQEYRRELRGRNEVLTRVGQPEWRVRFSPMKVGEYSLVVRARDKTGARATSAPIRFRAVESDTRGFVRVSPRDRRYFAFDSGEGYVPVGANVCWAGSRGTYDYDEWLPRYGESGCNYFRVWLAPLWMTFALERTGQPEDRYGVGKFDMPNAWRLDYVLNLAAQNGLYVMLCLDSFNELRMKKDGVYSSWESTPQNKANGGILNEPREFWTHPEMLRLYRNKLRYLVARYGWNTHVLSWQFWNEVDIISPSAFDIEEVTRWHAEMSDYLRSIDPWKHLQTTSYANSAGKPEIDSLPQIDYVLTHNYGSKDIAGSLSRWHIRKEVYGKPHYIGEFGVGAGGEDRKVDPTGIGLHNGIWGTLLSGAAGSAMLWWWDNHIHPNDLYYHFAALNRFIDGVDFPSEGFTRITDYDISFNDPPDEFPYQDLILEGPASWQKSIANRPTEVIVEREGKYRISNGGEVAGILHGTVNHADKHNPCTFLVDLPHPTKLRISVRGVSGYGGAHLIVDLNGERVIDKPMPDDPDSQETVHRYDGEYVVDLPRGKNEIKVENIGKDWVLVSYILERAERRTKPGIRCFGLKGERTILLWVQNEEHTWHRVNVLKLKPEPQSESTLKLMNVARGRYSVLFWDTYSGEAIESRELLCEGDTLAIQLPIIEKDIAIRITREDGGNE